MYQLLKNWVLDANSVQLEGKNKSSKSILKELRKFQRELLGPVDGKRDWSETDKKFLHLTHAYASECHILNCRLNDVKVKVDQMKELLDKSKGYQEQMVQNQTALENKVRLLKDATGIDNVDDV